MGSLDKAPRKSTDLAKGCFPNQNNKIMKEIKDKINPDNDSFDPSEEYFKSKSDTYENEEYFPQESSKPPHY